jgi:hypothetical protein
MRVTTTLHNDRSGRTYVDTRTALSCRNLLVRAAHSLLRDEGVTLTSTPEPPEGNGVWACSSVE